MGEISILSRPVAFAAGFVSLASPRVPALVPGHPSFTSGASFDQLGSRPADVVRPTAAFVAGSSVVFAAFGAGAGLIGDSFTPDQDALALVARVLPAGSSGPGISFLLAGLLFTRTMSASRWIRDRRTVVNATAAALVIAAGVLVASGRREPIARELADVGFTGI